MDVSSLKEAGLTEGEAKVYLALLELGSATTGPIVEKSGVARCIVYELLNKLVQKGLASYVIKEKTKHFQAASPSAILDFLEQRKRKLDENTKKIEELLPKFMALAESAKPAEARVYLGFRGTVAAHENTYKKIGKGEEFVSIGVPATQPEHYHAFWKRDHMRRAKAGIKTRILFHPKADRETLKNRNSYKGCQARYMPFEVNTPVWIMSYKDVRVLFLVSEKRPVAIEVANQEIADSFRAYFEDMWKRSKPFK